MEDGDRQVEDPFLRKPHIITLALSNRYLAVYDMLQAKQSLIRQKKVTCTYVTFTKEGIPTVPSLIDFSISVEV